MNVTIGDTTFDRVSYDASADVLYLHVGDPTTAVDFDESPEGHGLRFDSDGRLVGVTIVSARQEHLRGPRWGARHRPEGVSRGSCRQAGTLPPTGEGVDEGVSDPG